MNNIPVILICGTNPQNTQAVLDILELENIQSLYIFTESAQTYENIQRLNDTKKIIENIAWTSPELYHHNGTPGSRLSIPRILEYVFGKHPSALVLNDSIIPAESCFDYIRAAEQKYCDNPKIFGISAFSPPIPSQCTRYYPYDIFFHPRPIASAWLTWKNKWNCYNADLKNLFEKCLEYNIDLIQGGFDIPVKVETAIAENTADWLLNWTLTVYLQCGCFAYPLFPQTKKSSPAATAEPDAAGSGSYAHSLPITSFPDDIVYRDEIITFINDSSESRDYMVRANKIKNTQLEKGPLISSANYRFTTDCNDRIPILHLAENDDPAGPSHSIHTLDKSLRNIGRQSSVLLKNKTTFGENVKLFNNNIAGENNTQDILGVINNPEIKDAGVVHLHSSPAKLFNPFALSVLSHIKPVIWTLSDASQLTRICTRPVPCTRMNKDCEQCSRSKSLSGLPPENIENLKTIYSSSNLWLVAPSDSIKELLPNSILAGHPARKIYNPVDTSLFKPVDKTSIRSRLGLPQSSAVIAAAFDESDILPSDFDNIVKTLLQNFNDLIFINIGTGGRKVCPGLINDVKIGRSEQTAALLSSADVFIQPVIQNPGKNFIPEAMACGTPAVIFDSLETGGLLRDNTDGFVICDRDTRHFLASLEKLITDDSLRLTFSQNAAARALQSFDSRTVAAAHDSYYRTVLEEARKTLAKVKPYPLSKIPDEIKTREFFLAEKVKIGHNDPLKDKPLVFSEPKTCKITRSQYKPRIQTPGEPAEQNTFTVFSMPKAFTGRTARTQYNAVKSWRRLGNPEIILLGNDPGTAEAARSLNCKHIPDIKTNSLGTPLLNDMFEQAQAAASNDVLLYINADIILMDDFLDALNVVRSSFSEFLMTGLRFDVDYEKTINFGDPNWQTEFRADVLARGELHRPTGIDYFAFTKYLWPDIPPFALGRTAFDNWLLWDAFLRKPTIDATKNVLAVHPNHDYSHVEGDRRGCWQGPEAQQNRHLGGPKITMGTGYIWDTMYKLGPNGLEKKYPDRFPHLLDRFYTRLVQKQWNIRALTYRHCFSGAAERTRTQPPAVSFIIVSSQPDEQTYSAVENLNAKQQNAEIVFVDDGCPHLDKSRVIPLIDKYINLVENVAPNVPENIGAVYSDAPKLVFLNDKILADRSALEKIIEMSLFPAGMNGNIFIDASHFFSVGGFTEYGIFKETASKTTETQTNAQSLRITENTGRKSARRFAEDFLESDAPASKNPSQNRGYICSI